MFETENEHVVNPQVGRQLCAGAKFCQRVSLKSAKHEILMEQDQIRDRAIQNTLKFFTRH